MMKSPYKRNHISGERGMVEQTSPLKKWNQREGFSVLRKLTEGVDCKVSLAIGTEVPVRDCSDCGGFSRCRGSNFMTCGADFKAIEDLI